MYRTTSSTLKIDVPHCLRSIFMKRCDFDKSEIINKVTVIGLSPTAISIILTLFNDVTLGKICSFDLNSCKAQKELSELIVKAPTRFVCGSEYELTAGSDIIVIAMDTEFNPNMKQMMIPLEKLLKTIIPKIAELSPNAIYLNANRPNNILTHIIYKLSKAPKNRVFGIGTFPESLKLQYHLGELLNLSPTSILVQTIGSRRDPIPLWNSMSAGGVLIKDIIGDESICIQIINTIRNRRDKLASNKNYLDWTSAFGVWIIIHSILINRTALMPLACNAEDIYGIQEETFISLPCCLSRNGIAYAIKPIISERNKERILSMAVEQLRIQKEMGY